jgi:LuxR family maltose regulon positive regulatory protein
LWGSDLIQRDRLCDLLDERRRVAVIRAPIGYGKSVLLDQWLSSRSVDHQRIMLVSVDESDAEPAAFWQAVTAAVEAGSEAENESRRSQPRTQAATPTPVHLAELIERLREPLTLVMDRFEQMSDPQIVRDLVALIENSEHLHLILLGRTISGIDDLSQCRVPTTLISEADLAFTPEETGWALDEVDSTLSEGDLAAVHRELRGWPLAVGQLVRLLNDAQPQPQLARAMVVAATRACELLASATGIDPRHIGVLSMAKDLDLDVATALLAVDFDGEVTNTEAGLDPAMFLDLLQRNGSFSHTERALAGELTTIHWSPALRRVLHNDFVRQSPDLALRLDATLAEWYASHDAAGLAFVHAARAGQWDLVLALFEGHSTSLLEIEWGEFTNAIATAPYDVIATSAAGIAWRTIALHLPIDPRANPDPRTLTTAESAAIGQSPRAREMLEAQFWQLVLYRRRGMFEQAATASDNAHTIMQEAMTTRASDVAGLQSLVLTHSALLHEILGEFRAAIAEFGQAYELAPMSELSFSAADAAGKVAMSYAMLGDEHNASIWLQREAVAPVSKGSVAPYVRSAGLIARALVASVTLQADQCSAVVDTLHQIAHHDELWPFVAFARKRQALIWGDRENALDELENLGASPDLFPVSPTAGGVETWLLPAAKAELLMALGRGNHAKAVLDAADHDHPLLGLARTRLALLSGDNEAAIAFANAVGDRQAGYEHRGVFPADRVRTVYAPQSWQLTSPLQRLETLIILGMANYRLGATDTGADLLRRAVNQAQRLGSLLPFARVPRDELFAIADHVPSLAELLRDQAFGTTPEIYPASVNLVVLTERERAILEGFSAGLSLREIASANYVSTNTIKTQTRTLYRKLHANSRHEAVATASALQLLDRSASIDPDRRLRALS